MRTIGTTEEDDDDNDCFIIEKEIVRESYYHGDETGSQAVSA